MIRNRAVRLSLLSIVIIFLSSSIFAQSANIYKLRLKAGSGITIHGDSTMHAYATKSEIIGLDSDILFKNTPKNLDLTMNALMNKLHDPQLKKLIMSIAVKNFNSSTVGFNSKFRETLKDAENPYIVFFYSGYSSIPDKNNKNRYYLKIDGMVKIAGVSKPISVDATADIYDHSVILKGQKDLLMTDFMITPPKLLFVTADNKVTVKWELDITIDPASK